MNVLKLFSVHFAVIFVVALIADSCNSSSLGSVPYVPHISFFHTPSFDIFIISAKSSISIGQITTVQHGYKRSIYRRPYVLTSAQVPVDNVTVFYI